MFYNTIKGCAFLHFTFEIQLCLINNMHNLNNYKYLIQLFLVRQVEG